jgi:hypothetical protein
VTIPSNLLADAASSVAAALHPVTPSASAAVAAARITIFLRNEISLFCLIVIMSGNCW